jgi:hypothetical protein
MYVYTIAIACIIIVTAVTVTAHYYMRLYWESTLSCNSASTIFNDQPASILLSLLVLVLAFLVLVLLTVTTTTSTVCKTLNVSADVQLLC